jgi:ariadne-1
MSCEDEWPEEDEERGHDFNGVDDDDDNWDDSEPTGDDMGWLAKMQDEAVDYDVLVDRNLRESRHCLVDGSETQRQRQGESERKTELASSSSSSSSSSTSSSSSSVVPLFECLTRDELRRRCEQRVEVVKPILVNLDEASMRALLLYFRFDLAKLMEEYCDEPGKYNDMLGLGSGEKPNENEENDDDDEAFECPICYCGAVESKTMECGHRLCVSCWRHYLRGEVREKCATIACPALDGDDRRCGRVLSERVILELIGDHAEHRERFEDALIGSFVQASADVRWCVNPRGCDSAIRLSASAERETTVRCLCGCSFCFACGGLDHRPAFCSMMTDWQELASDEKLTMRAFASLNVKKCPKCGVPTERSSGCAHITCRCGYHYCYLCSGKFGKGPMGGNDGYSSHQCNVWGGADEDRYVVKWGKADGKDGVRLQFYVDRFDAHARSERLERAAMTSEAQPIASEMTTSLGVTWTTANRYLTAFEQLVENRRTLCASYVFGYFRPMLESTKIVHKELFENLQVDVERYTTELSSLLGCGPQHAAAESIFASIDNISKLSSVAATVRDALIDIVISTIRSAEAKELRDDIAEARKRARSAQRQQSNDDVVPAAKRARNNLLPASSETLPHRDVIEIGDDDSSDDDRWQCLECTLINASDVDRCIVCDSGRFDNDSD